MITVQEEAKTKLQNLIAEGTPAEILDNQQVRAVYLGEQFKL